MPETKHGKSRGRSKTVSLKVPASLDSELEALASRRGVGKSSLVREALAEYLPAQSGHAQGSFLSRARRFAGCVEGPSDLAANADHLAGYGR